MDVGEKSWKTYPIAFDFIPAKHGIENFPRIGQEIQILPDKNTINKIVYTTHAAIPEGFFDWDEDEQDRFLREDGPRMEKQMDADDNIIAAPAEIVRALGIGAQQLAEIKQSRHELSTRELLELLGGDNQR
jgi:hypothetical protein